MPILKLYVSNVLTDATVQELGKVFADHGEIQELIRIYRNGDTEITKSCRLVIDTEHTLEEFLSIFNGYVFKDQPIFLTQPAPKNKDVPITAQTRALAKEYSMRLGEKEKAPRRQILMMVHQCGPAFIETLYKLTMKTEQEGGMMTKDQTRRRTTGGVFFFLGRGFISYRLQRSIFFIPENNPPKQQKPSKDKAAKNPSKGKAKTPPPKHAKPVKRPIATREVPPEELADAQKRLAELRISEKDAQEKLDLAQETKKGLFSATRALATIQKDISTLLRKYPQLT